MDGERVAMARGQDGGAETHRMLFGTLLVVMAAAVWPTLLSFHDVWTSYTYSHGYLVAAVSLWLLWHGGRRLSRRDGAGSPLGGFALVALSLLWLAATIMNLRVVHQATLPLLVVAWAATVSGREGAMDLLPAAAAFLFAVPLWEILIPPLQALTIMVSGAAVQALGIQADIAGEIITIPSGSFQVAGSCAGLSFFIVGTFLGAAYAYLFIERWPVRIGAVAMAAGTATVANWARVTGLIVIGDVTEMTHGLLQEHGIYGWVIFAAAFLGLVVVLNRWTGRKGGKRPARPAASMTQQPPPPAADRRRPRDRVLLATALFLLGPLLHIGVGAVPARADAPIPIWIQPTAGDWTVLESAERPFDWRPAFEGATEARSAIWTNGTMRVHQDRIIYPKQTQGAELFGDGNRIAPSSRILGERTTWLGDLDKAVHEVVVSTPDGPVLVWYWYRVAGVETVSKGWGKILELWGFFSRRPAAEVEALSASCAADQCEEAAAGLRELMRFRGENAGGAFN